MPKLVTAILAKDEADRYLRRVLTRCLEFSDSVLVLDDRSTDATPKLAADLGCRVRTRSVLKGDAWGREAPARAELWDWAATEAGDGWVLICDADMLLHGDPRPLCLSTEVNSWAFVLYDLWTEDERFARCDGFWRAHTIPRPWLFRPSRGVGNIESALVKPQQLHRSSSDHELHNQSSHLLKRNLSLLQHVGDFHSRKRSSHRSMMEKEHEKPKNHDEEDQQQQAVHAAHQQLGSANRVVGEGLAYDSVQQPSVSDNLDDKTLCEAKKPPFLESVDCTPNNVSSANNSGILHDFKWLWSPRGIHVGHAPTNFALHCAVAPPADYYWLHLGYCSLHGRQLHFSRYQAVEAQLSDFEKQHAASILDG